MRRLLLLLSALVLGALAACGAESAEQVAVDPDSPIVTVYSSPA